MTLENLAQSAPVLVVCLCADWCGVCGEYRSRFEQMQSKFPHARFLWVDVEDDADLMHPLDVDNFPTLLLAVGDEPRFFGSITPQAEMLERLIRAQTASASVSALPSHEVGLLLARIREAKLG